MDTRNKIFRAVSMVQVVGAGITVAINLVLLLTNKQTQLNPVIPLTLLGNSLAMILFYFSFYQIVKRKSLRSASVSLTAISLVNLGIIIALTGGLDSPFYSIWLMVTVLAGLWGLEFSAVIVLITVVGYAALWYLDHFSIKFLNAHAIQFGMTVAVAIMTEWIYSKASLSGFKQVDQISGQLSEEQLKSQVLVDNMGEGVVVVDKNRLIQLFNPAACNLTGWTQPEAKQINYLTVMKLKTADDQDLTDFNDPFLQAWAKGETANISTLAMTTKTGRKIAVTLTVSPIYDTKHEITGGIALFRDISAEKEIERQRDEFISTASHEMRTPVAAIEGYLSLAMNEKVATVDDRAHNFLEKAHDTTTHLGALFRDLLSITKLEEGKVGGPVGPLDVGKLVKSAVSDMQFSANKKNLNLSVQTNGTPVSEKNMMPIFVANANEERLREVVMNLMENAFKFTAEGGVTIDVSGDNDTVTVKVGDTGLGISPEDLPHLFQKFYRVDNSATRTIGGTGLGLYLCRSIIEHFNGRIWVESTIGRGSSFNFNLPRLPSDTIPSSAVDIAAPVGTASVVAVQLAPPLAPAPLAAVQTAGAGPTGTAPAPLPALYSPATSATSVDGVRAPSIANS